MEEQAPQTTEDPRVTGYRRLRAMGLPKPASAPQALWDSAGPYTVEVAVDATRSQLNRRIVEKAQEQLPKDEKAMVQHLFPQALATHVDVMVNAAKDSDRLNASQFIIEHSIGKATQTVEHTGSLALEVHNSLEKLCRDIRSGSVIDTENLLAKPKTPVDTFLEKHMPQRYVVGKKVAQVEQEEQQQSTKGLPERTGSQA